MIFFVNSKIKKSIMNWCNSNLRPNCIVTKISTLTKSKLPNGGYSVYVKINNIGKIDHNFVGGFTNGDFFLDDNLKVIGNELGQADKVFFDKSLMNEAEDILKEN